MKYRAGFVSNSSSSSFVVAVPKDSVLIEKLADLMEADYCCDDNIEHIRTESYESVEGMLTYNYGWCTDDVSAAVDTIMAAAKCDLEVYEVEIGYRASDETRDFFHTDLKPYIIDSWD